MSNDAPWSKWYRRAHWRNLCDQFRAEQPERATICQGTVEVVSGITGLVTTRQCMKPATCVDHIKAHRGDWDLFVGGVNFENLQGLCTQCHNEKSARELHELGQISRVEQHHPQQAKIVAMRARGVQPIIIAATLQLDIATVNDVLAKIARGPSQ